MTCFSPSTSSSPLLSRKLSTQGQTGGGRGWTVDTQGRAEPEPFGSDLQPQSLFGLQWPLSLPLWTALGR